MITGPVLLRLRLRHRSAAARSYCAALAIWLGWLGSAFGGLVPRNATVILLSGLPGDIESEASYSQQLQGWLDLLSNQGQAQRFLVFGDKTDGMSARASSKVEMRKGNRENFLQLTNELASLTNPLVVIAWGHGGLQGSTPVLHVRGPRLAPNDFKTLAERVPTDSVWILMFRERSVCPKTGRSASLHPRFRKQYRL